MEIIRNEGVWRLFEKTVALIITDEKQLETIVEDPSKPLIYNEDKGVSWEEKSIYEGSTSLINICKEGVNIGAVRLEVSYDFFFGGSERRNYPDSELTLKAFKVIHDIACQYGLGFSASIISPLDIGGGYAKTHNKTGFTCQYKEGNIDKTTGEYTVEMVLQKQWTNNKGPIKLSLEKVKVYAFNEEQIEGTCYYYVNPESIIDISTTANFEEDAHPAVVTGAGYGYEKLHVRGQWCRESGFENFDRCLAVAIYKTPELDYFSNDALPYVKSVIDLHKEAGIIYQGFYSDEMHIQFDWDMEAHFGHNEINTRYFTDNLASEYAQKYGVQFKDFLKYLVYFSYHQHDFLDGDEGTLANQHVFGKDEKGIYDTWMFRKRYFEMLQDRVVGLSLEAKKYAEELYGAPIMTRAHATWQESPTCDCFNESFQFSEIPVEEYSRYDYSSDYIWSSSIRENMSACYDYFKWNDFLCGGGTDHPEGGFTDRNYYAEALAASLGQLNQFPYAYCADWGSPQEVSRRINNVRNTYGNMNFTAEFADNMVQGMSSRLTEVLALYPLDLNYVEERFGSWMVQYGYCDYITENKLLEYTSILPEGCLLVNGRKYRSLLVLFQPFIKGETLKLIKDFVQSGGKVVWTSIHPVWCGSYEAAEEWKELFGVKELQPSYKGICLKQQAVCFKGILSGIRPMEIITDLLPDFVYPVVPMEETEVIAYSSEYVIGTSRKETSGGMAVYLGFRPRDDQSCSTGKDVDTLYSVLQNIGCYGPDSTSMVSRPQQSRYIIHTFDNGALSLANHYRTFNEKWKGKFFRDKKEDEEFLRGRLLPEVNIDLENYELQGHIINYKGTDVLTYNIDKNGVLIGFAGSNCTGITIDGRKYEFTDLPTRIIWTRVDEKFLAQEVQELYMVYLDSPCRAKLPIPLKNTDNMIASVCEKVIFESSKEIPVVIENNHITLNITDAEAGKWIAIFRKKINL